MNYLAHAFLSFNQPELMVGNLMGDFVKGNNYEKYSGDLRRGLLLHRAIDQFTDQHNETEEAVKLLKPTFRLSSGIFVDILFDHLLANDLNYFTNDTLIQFTEEVHFNLDQHHHHFDEKMITFFGYMKQYNWLYNYKFEEGLSRSIIGICKRYPRLGDGQVAFNMIQLHLPTFKQHFEKFFPDLIHHSRQFILNTV